MLDGTYFWALLYGLERWSVIDFRYSVSYTKNGGGIMVIIHMRNVPGKPNHRALDKPLPYMTREGKQEYIPKDFEWDGSSVPWFAQGIFPRHRHPVASCRHDKRCGDATCAEDRKFADLEFRKDVRKTSWWITAAAGYYGVRIGAFLGIGSNF